MSYTRDGDAVFQAVAGASVITCLLFVILKYSELHRDAAKASSVKMKGFEGLCSQSSLN